MSGGKRWARFHDLVGGSTGQAPRQEKKSASSGVTCVNALVSTRKEQVKGQSFYKNSGTVIVIEEVTPKNLRPERGGNEALAEINQDPHGRLGAQIKVFEREKVRKEIPEGLKQWDRPFVFDANGQRVWREFFLAPGFVVPVENAFPKLVDEMPTNKESRFYDVREITITGSHERGESTKEPGVMEDYTKAQVTGVGSNKRQFMDSDADHPFENLDRLQAAIINMCIAGYDVDQALVEAIRKLNRYVSGFLVRVGGFQVPAKNGECLPGQHVRGCLVGESPRMAKIDEKTVKLEVPVVDVTINSDWLVCVRRQAEAGDKRKRAGDAGEGPEDEDGQGDDGGEGGEQGDEGDDTENGAAGKEAVSTPQKKGSASTTATVETVPGYGTPTWFRYRLVVGTEGRNHYYTMERELGVNATEIESVYTFWKLVPFMDTVMLAYPDFDEVKEESKEGSAITTRQLQVSCGGLFVSPQSIADLAVPLGGSAVSDARTELVLNLLDKCKNFGSKIPAPETNQAAKEAVEGILSSRGFAFVGKHVTSVLRELLKLQDVYCGFIPQVWKIAASEKAADFEWEAPAGAAPATTTTTMRRLIAHAGLQAEFDAMQKDGADKKSKCITTFTNKLTAAFELDQGDGDVKSLWQLVMWRQPSSSTPVKHFVTKLVNEVHPGLPSLPLPERGDGAVTGEGEEGDNGSGDENGGGGDEDGGDDGGDRGMEEGGP